MLGLTDEAMYQAVISDDIRYDGVFLYAVKTTGIVCRPSCKSKVPNRDNVSFFATLEEALAQGYRPCKRCRPDLGPCYLPENDILEAACEMIKTEYTDPELLATLPFRIGISSSHLQRLFRKAVGCTPRAYLRKVRIAHATQLLKARTMGHLAISLAVGFTSLSSFYIAFRDETGLSPRQYRRNERPQDPDEDRISLGDHEGDHRDRS